MSDQEPVFGQDWEEQIQKSQEKKKQQQQKKRQAQAKQTKSEKKENWNNAQSNNKKILDPKQLLRQKIQQYKQMSIEDFQSRCVNTSVKTRTYYKNPIPTMLKTDKDFIKFSKEVARRFTQQCQGKTELDDAKIQSFFNQILLSIFQTITWNNVAKIQAKLKITINERKEMQKKWEKQRKKKNMGKKQEDIDIKSIFDNKDPNDDLFVGAGLNSKQQEEELRKQKTVQKQLVSQTSSQKHNDNDDFI